MKPPPGPPTKPGAPDRQPIPGIRAIPAIPVGYPLSYFAMREPFASWLRIGRDARPPDRGPRRKGQKKPPKPPETQGPPEWTNYVRLERFTSRRISRFSKIEPYSGKYDDPNRPYSGAYEYIVEFTTTRQIAIALPEPKGTVALFGTAVKPGRPPGRLRLRFIVEPKNGTLIRLDISGALRFRLPRSLVRPVVEHNHEWVDGEIKHVVVPLGRSMLTLSRGLRPRVSPPLAAPSVTVRLGATPLVAKLGFAHVDISGTAAKPRIRFKKIRLVYISN
jgi:hypothetical protein